METPLSLKIWALTAMTLKLENAKQDGESVLERKKIDSLAETLEHPGGVLTGWCNTSAMTSLEQ